jgi:hypothetical protein
MSELGSAEAGNPESAAAETEVAVETTPAIETTELTKSDWVSADYQEVVDAKGWQSADDVLKSYVNLEKAMGKERLALPEADQDINEWDGWNKLGTPETADGYELKVPEGMEGYSQDLSDWFRQSAHDAKLPSHMAQKLHDGFVQRALDQHQSQALDSQRQVEDWTTEIKKEYGTAYEDKIGVAKRAVRAFGSDDLINILDTTGLGNHPEMIRTFVKIGAELSSGAQFKEAESSGKFGMTPQDAKEAIAEIRNNPGLMDTRHPEHKVLNDRLTQLYEVAFPENV